MTNSQNVQTPAENLIPVFTAEIGGISTLAVNAENFTSFLESNARCFQTGSKKELPRTNSLKVRIIGSPKLGSL